MEQRDMTGIHVPKPVMLYLSLLKRCLTRQIFPDSSWDDKLLDQTAFDSEKREVGSDWPTEAETMVGMKRLENLEYCILQCIFNNVPGDLVETGIWRGGCGILMRAVLAAFEQTDRVVWLVDSFAGLPAPDPEHYPQDEGDKHGELTSYLGVSLQAVKNNFRRYELLDDQVRFLKGWFRDTLPKAPIERIAVLRLDGDMYESTYVALEALYDKVVPGGFVIVDDYGALPNCRIAVEDFRSLKHINEEIISIDWTGVYWTKRV